jgi:hypothetical protein
VSKNCPHGVDTHSFAVRRGFSCPELLHAVDEKSGYNLFYGTRRTFPASDGT